MKQFLPASAMLAAATAIAAISGAAHAQSNITINGIIDGGLRNQTNTSAAGDSKLTMGSNGIYLANRLGFSGTEDLGGGNKAKFMLETGFNAATGALDNANNVLFNRSAWVGLAGDWGSLVAGRQYTVAYATVLDYNPVGSRYISLVPLGAGAGSTLPAAAIAAGLGASATSGSRFNNDVQYRGAFGPVMLLAEYAAGEQAGSMRNGAAQSLGLKYTQGPVYLGGAYTKKKTISGFDNTAYTAGGSYRYGAFKASAGLARESQDSLAAGVYRNQQSWAGLAYTLSPQVELVSAWYHTHYSNTSTGERDMFFVAANYQLSKRTLLYANVDRNRYEGALIPTTRQTGQTGVSLGVNHGF